MTVSMSTLGENASITMGQSPPGDTYNRGGHGAPLLNGPTEFGPRNPIAQQWTTSPKKFCEVGDVLFCVRGATAGRLNIADRKYCLGRGLAAIRGNAERFDTEFLRYVLANGYAKFQSRGVGSTFINISAKELASFPVPDLPLAEQKRIAGILDAADALRAKRRESLEQLDTLLQSTFLDMFGDPVTNPMGWEVEVFDSWLENIDNGWSPKCLDRKASDDEWGILKLGAVTWCEFDESEQKALPPDCEPRPNIEVRPGDLLFARKNTYQLVAAAAYVHDCRPKLMLSDLVFRIRLKSEIDVEPTFLWQLLIQPHQRQVIQRFAGGAAGSMPNISKAKLKTVRLIRPPLELQHHFAAIVESVELQKACQGAHLDELDILFASLQSRAFNGEL